MTDCGAAHESCCASILVPGGTYYRTYDLDDAGNGVVPPDGGPIGEADPATVSGFRLDKYLVTVGRFRQFVNAWNKGAGYLPAEGSGKHSHLNAGKGLTATGGGYEPGWVAADDANVAPTADNLGCQPAFATWTASPGGNEDLPMNCVNWWEAYAFCIWDGGFLPSEAEWEYAAAGGAEQRLYPWGSADPGMANQYAIYGCLYPDASAMCLTFANIAPVGTPALGGGLWGQLDLAGENWEWNLDWVAAYANPCTDCVNITPSTSRMLRGGDFTYVASVLFSPYRSYTATPDSRDEEIGFRCARSP
jgi:formylglycine-generating enzyme required for sulfatase activity